MIKSIVEIKGLGTSKDGYYLNIPESSNNQYHGCGFGAIEVDNQGYFKGIFGYWNERQNEFVDYQANTDMNQIVGIIFPAKDDSGDTLVTCNFSCHQACFF